MANERRTLQTILSEMKALQDQFRGKVMPQPDGETFEALGAEAKALQDEADRDKEIKQFEQFAREIPNPALPRSTPESKAADGDLAYTGPDAVVGYLGLGDGFVASSEYKDFLRKGMPQGGSDTFTANGASVTAAAIPITRKMLADERHGPELKRALALEGKAVATIGGSVVRADRQADVIRFAERNRLTMRDLVQTLPTSSSSIDWVTISSYTNAAAPVAESAVKPEATAALSSGSATVRTLAVTMPVTEQQLQDVPQIQAIINDELTFDLKYTVEETQMLWGDGTGQNLLGIFPTPGVAVGRTVAGDTIIDQIRRAMTDVQLGFLEPNGLVIDPLDWESVVLTKGTDTHYLYQAFPDGTGALRVWGLAPVVTVAVRNPVPTVAPTTRERRFLVGDFRRGATLWDRQQLNVAVGWINDQFVRNQRTIRVEERVAFATRRPAAFKYRITQALVA